MSWTFEGGWQKNKGNLQLHMEKGTQKADWCGQDGVIWAIGDHFKVFRTTSSSNVYFFNCKILFKMQLWGFLLKFLLPPTCVTCKSLQLCTSSFFFFFFIVHCLVIFYVCIFGVHAAWKNTQETGMEIQQVSQWLKFYLQSTKIIIPIRFQP